MEEIMKRQYYIELNFTGSRINDENWQKEIDVGLKEEDLNLWHLGRLRNGNKSQRSDVSGGKEALYKHQGFELWLFDGGE